MEIIGAIIIGCVLALGGISVIGPKWWIAVIVIGTYSIITSILKSKIKP